jgi:hypothetical protein
MNMQVLESRRDVSGGYKVDVSRGERIGRVSSEWFSRPDDERFLSLGDLARSVRGRSERSRTRVVETALIHVEANRSDPERLALILPGADAPVLPTHCGLVTVWFRSLVFHYATFASKAKGLMPPRYEWRLRAL